MKQISVNLFNPGGVVHVVFPPCDEYCHVAPDQVGLLGTTYEHVAWRHTGPCYWRHVKAVLDVHGPSHPMDPGGWFGTTERADNWDDYYSGGGL